MAVLLIESTIINIIRTEISFLCKIFLLVEIGLVSIAPYEMKIKSVIFLIQKMKNPRNPKKDSEDQSWSE